MEFYWLPRSIPELQPLDKAERRRVWREAAHSVRMKPSVLLASFIASMIMAFATGNLFDPGALTWSNLRIHLPIAAGAIYVGWLIYFQVEATVALPCIRKLIGGLCTNCGYDIRASSGHCPECGKEIEGEKLPQN